MCDAGRGNTACATNLERQRCRTADDLKRTPSRRSSIRRAARMSAGSMNGTLAILSRCGATVQNRTCDTRTSRLMRRHRNGTVAGLGATRHGGAGGRHAPRCRVTFKQRPERERGAVYAAFCCSSTRALMKSTAFCASAAALKISPMSDFSACNHPSM